jgi:hypothetical protein
MQIKKFEKYGSRGARKHCNFSNIENPYQIPLVQRLREKSLRECACDALLGGEGAELRCKRPAKRGDFRPVRARERMLAKTRLAAEIGFGLSVRKRFRSLERSTAWLPASTSRQSQHILPENVGDAAPGAEHTGLEIEYGIDRCKGDAQARDGALLVQMPIAVTRAGRPEAHDRPQR